LEAEVRHLNKTENSVCDAFKDWDKLGDAIRALGIRYTSDDWKDCRQHEYPVVELKLSDNYRKEGVIWPVMDHVLLEQVMGSDPGLGWYLSQASDDNIVNSLPRSLPYQAISISLERYEDPPFGTQWCGQK